MQRTRILQLSLAVAVVLLGVAALWAAWRSRGAAVDAGAPETAGEAGSPHGGLGAEVFESECAGCHPGGQAIGALPPLRGHAVELLRSEGGRGYLIEVLLDGNVRTEEGLEPRHPTFEHLADVELAAVLDHTLRSWGNAALLDPATEPYEPAEIAARRPDGR